MANSVLVLWVKIMLIFYKGSSALIENWLVLGTPDSPGDSHCNPEILTTWAAILRMMAGEEEALMLEKGPVTCPVYRERADSGTTARCHDPC